MKTLVVYYSRTGNTKLVANEIAAALGADIEELKDGKNRGGPIGFIRSGREAKRKETAHLEPLSHAPSEYDVVVVGSPIWANTICAPTRTFLAQHRTHLKKVAWFCTSGSINPGYAAKGFQAMTDESGLTPVATLGMGRREIKGDHTEALAGFTAALNGKRP